MNEDEIRELYNSLNQAEKKEIQRDMKAWVQKLKELASQ